jgi:4'-phosphopantetheinyl transferase
VPVWRADLDGVSDDLGGLLCAEERARAEGILRARTRWMRSRGVLRALLGRYLEEDPRALRFTTGAHGKPALTTPSSPLSFNLSPSGGLGLYAFTRAGEVGVDVELPRRALNQLALAARAFGEGEARRLQALDQALRRRELLRAWTQHEARLKWAGSGIGADRGGAGEREPWVGELELGEQGAGAVALDEPPGELRCWEWQA